MAKRKWLHRESTELIEVDTYQVNLKIIRERRKSVRTSIGKDAVFLRIPYWSSKEQEEKLRLWCLNWLKKKHLSSGVLSRLQRSPILDGQFIETAYHKFEVSLKYADRKTGKGHIDEKIIHLTLPQNQDFEAEQDLIRKLINQLLGKRFESVFAQRVHAMNEAFFQQNLKSVKLRYNYSKWGSCSSSHQIVLSTRLVFAPQEVVDYVILHELAHLLEMNHSERFWKIVAHMMPDYQVHEIWLKENAWKCDY